jgi:hypothetical protein
MIAESAGYRKTGHEGRTVPGVTQTDAVRLLEKASYTAGWTIIHFQEYHPAEFF